MKHFSFKTVRRWSVVALCLAALLALVACDMSSSSGDAVTETKSSTEASTSAVTGTDSPTETSTEVPTDTPTETAVETPAATDAETPVETKNPDETETTPAPNPGDSYYIALGDSIARGYGIDLKAVTYDDAGNRTVVFNSDFYLDDGTATFAPGTYTAGLRDLLLSSGSVDAAYNFARSGDTCGDLVAFINEFYDAEAHTAKNPDAPNSRYASLTNGQIFTAMQDAEVVSVCIGANNVLVPAIELLVKYIAGEITYEQMEQSTREALLGNGTDSGLEAELNVLLARLHALCPDAEIVFTTIYNPYRKMEVGEGMQFLQMLGAILDAEGKMKNIEALSEIAIAGGKDSTGKELAGINGILTETITAFAKANGGRFHLADTKALFDATVTPDRNYCDYVNTDMGLLTVKDAGNYRSYADPHPTEAGHAILLEAHKKVLNTLDLAGD